MTARPGRSGVYIDVLAGCLYLLATAPALQCPAAMVATGVKDYWNLFPAPVSAFATFTLSLAFNPLTLCFRVFPYTRRANRTHDGWLGTFSLEALNTIVFGNKC